MGVHSFLPVSNLGERSAGVHSFFPVLVKLGRAIVWGYSFLPVSKQAEKSAGVHSFFPLFSKSWESNSVGEHSFLPISKLGGKCPRVHSFFLGRDFRKAFNLVWGYTLSCLFVRREGRVQGYTLSFPCT